MKCFHHGQTHLLADKVSLIFGVSRDTMFTALLTLTVFLLGYMLTRLYDNRKEKICLSEVKKFMLHSLGNWNLGIEIQLKDLDKNIIEMENDLVQDESKTIAMIRPIGISIEVIPTPLRSIDHTDIFKIIVTDKKQDLDHRSGLCSVLFGNIELANEFYVNIKQQIPLMAQSYQDKQDQIVSLKAKIAEVFKIMLHQNFNDGKGGEVSDEWTLGAFRVYEKYLLEHNPEYIESITQNLSAPLMEHSFSYYQKPEALEVLPSNRIDIQEYA